MSKTKEPSPYELASSPDNNQLYDIASPQKGGEAVYGNTTFAAGLNGESSSDDGIYDKLESVIPVLNPSAAAIEAARQKLVDRKMEESQILKKQEEFAKDQRQFSFASGKTTASDSINHSLESETDDNKDDHEYEYDTRAVGDAKREGVKNNWNSDDYATNVNTQSYTDSEEPIYEKPNQLISATSGGGVADDQKNTQQPTEAKQKAQMRAASNEVLRVGAEELGVGIKRDETQRDAIKGPLLTIDTALPSFADDALGGALQTLSSSISDIAAKTAKSDIALSAFLNLVQNIFAAKISSAEKSAALKEAADEFSFLKHDALKISLVEEVNRTEDALERLSKSTAPGLKAAAEKSSTKFSELSENVAKEIMDEANRLGVEVKKDAAAEEAKKPEEAPAVADPDAKKDEPAAPKRTQAEIDAAKKKYEAVTKAFAAVGTVALVAGMSVALSPVFAGLAIGLVYYLKNRGKKEEVSKEAEALDGTEAENKQTVEDILAEIKSRDTDGNEITDNDKKAAALLAAEEAAKQNDGKEKDELVVENNDKKKPVVQAPDSTVDDKKPEPKQPEANTPKLEQEPPTIIAEATTQAIESVNEELVAVQQGLAEALATIQQVQQQPAQETAKEEVVVVTENKPEVTAPEAVTIPPKVEVKAAQAPNSIPTITITDADNQQATPEIDSAPPLTQSKAEAQPKTPTLEETREDLQDSPKSWLEKFGKTDELNKTKSFLEKSGKKAKTTDDLFTKKVVEDKGKPRSQEM